MTELIDISHIFQPTREYFKNRSITQSDYFKKRIDKMINNKVSPTKLMELGFEPFWNMPDSLMFTQVGGFGAERPHHIIYTKEKDIYFFRGLGHTITSFETIEELKELIDKYINKRI